MRGLVVGIVGAVALVLAATGLLVTALRPGPADLALEPALIAVAVEGTYLARGDSATIVGLCPAPPCEARTEIEATLCGLPDVPVQAFLAGGPRPRLALGDLERGEDGSHRLTYASGDDESDRDRIVLAVAGADVAAVPVAGGPAGRTLAERVTAQWPDPPAGMVRVAEIGAVTVSTVALLDLRFVVPDGWALVAWFEGAEGRVDLGALDPHGTGDDAGRFVLDGRVERVRLADQDRFVVALRPASSDAVDGFAVLAASL